MNVMLWDQHIIWAASGIADEVAEQFALVELSVSTATTITPTALLYSHTLTDNVERVRRAPLSGIWRFSLFRRRRRFPSVADSAGESAKHGGYEWTQMRMRRTRQGPRALR